jgi:hypothetical protein
MKSLWLMCSGNETSEQWAILSVISCPTLLAHLVLPPFIPILTIPTLPSILNTAESCAPSHQSNPFVISATRYVLLSDVSMTTILLWCATLHQKLRFTLRHLEFPWLEMALAVQTDLGSNCATLHCAQASRSIYLVRGKVGRFIFRTNVPISSQC